jgi:hypothetical protein
MGEAYHVTVFDNFHRGDPPWVIGTYSTAEEAIASVKGWVDQELEGFWSQLCRYGGHSTLDGLISQYNAFAETPVAFNGDGEVIFDTTAYMKSRAAEITEAAAQHGPQRTP